MYPETLIEKIERKLSEFNQTRSALRLKVYLTFLILIAFGGLVGFGFGVAKTESDPFDFASLKNQEEKMLKAPLEEVDDLKKILRDELEFIEDRQSDIVEGLHELDQKLSRMKAKKTTKSPKHKKLSAIHSPWENDELRHF